MGLLDDAIREHLELKRKHGADPDEVARQQDEALGDPRSGEFVKADEPAATPEPEPEPAAGPQPEGDVAQEPPVHAAFEPEPQPVEPPDAPWLDDDPPAA